MLRVEGHRGAVGLLPLDGEPVPRMLLTSEFAEWDARLSPDGRFLAYVSNESGQPEIYVRSVEGRGKWQVSADWGLAPAWSRDGKELFFFSGSALWVAEVAIEGANFRAGRTREVIAVSSQHP